MKKILLSLLILVIPLFLVLNSHENMTAGKEEKENEKTEEIENSSGERIAKKEAMKDYHKLENSISVEERMRLWQTVENYPQEDASVNAAFDWKSIGPFGMTVLANNSKMTGRVLDVKPPYGNAGLRIATCNGGLWEYGVLVAFPLSDNVPTLAIGSFDSHPDSSDVIIIGTGEPGGTIFSNPTGTGLYRTSNRGTNWVSIPMTPVPNNFHKVRFHPIDKQIVFAATDLGLYKSTTGGTSFSLNRPGNYSDFVYDVNSPGWIYTSKIKRGIFYSSDYGVTWDSSVVGLPPDIGDIKIDIAKSNSAIMYASISSDSLCVGNTNLPFRMKVYKSVNYGFNWVRINNRINGVDYLDYSYCQGYYNNIVSINPVNPNIVIVGGGSIQLTTNGGTNWTEPADDHHHDHHCTAWDAAGNTFYSGSDGGIATTTNLCADWNSIFNFIPLTQFYDGDVGTSNPNVMIGGAQDNANPMTTNGADWIYRGAGDGWSGVVSPSNANNLIISWNSSLQKTTDGGQNFINSSSGIQTISPISFFTSDRYSPLNIYFYTNGYLYKTITGGTSYQNLNQQFQLSASRCPISAEKGSATNANEVVYIPSGSSLSGSSLYVYMNGVMNNRSATLPFGRSVWRVSPHPRDTAIAYAILPATGLSNQIYKTRNRGVNWYNVSGNFPGVPVKDMQVNPIDSNIMVACTGGFGYYKSTNAGQNWYRWNNGAPKGTFSDKMTYIDSVGVNRFYVVSFTNGRGVYIRNINNQDSILTGVSNTNLKLDYKLSQNYPNPFNPSTNIKYSVSKTANVKITIFDLAGKKVAELVNEKKSPGIYDVIFNGSNISSGIYFYRMETENFTETKKMILIK